MTRTMISLLLAVATLAPAQSTHSTAPHKAKEAELASTHYYGAIDLGSKGTKAALYSFVTEEDGRDPVVIFSKTVNTKLVSSMHDGKFSPDGIADATSAVKDEIAAMKTEAATRRLHVDVYYVVGSSGVAKATNKEDLATSVHDATGIDMDFVDAMHEGYYGMLSSVPMSRRASSFYIDIGSGNAKLGCIVGGSDLSSFKSAEIPYGSVSGRNEALKRNPTDVNAGVDSLMTDVASAYEQQSRDVPCLRNRERIYWTGGAAWATATYTHPERALNGWVSITHKDLERFRASLKDGTWNQKHPIFEFPKDMPEARQAQIRARAAKDRDDVQNVFVREDLLAGVSIMEAVLNSSNPSAVIRFARDGNFIYGYALEKFKEDSESAGQ
jgi:exopolyphosphatase/pppGpp-phosphohydrolase